MQDGEPQVYTSLATLRNAQVQLQWSFFQLFFIFNSAAISVVIGSKIAEALKLSLAGSALLAHFGLCFANWRAVRWLEFYDEKLAILEELDQEENTVRARIAVFSSDEFLTQRGNRWARRGYLLVYVFGIVFWLSQTMHYANFFF
jgi:hypothetical protein